MVLSGRRETVCDVVMNLLMNIQSCCLVKDTAHDLHHILSSKYFINLNILAQVFQFQNTIFEKKCIKLRKM